MNKIKYWFSLIGSVDEVVNKIGITRPTYYSWCKGHIPVYRVDTVVKAINLINVNRKEIIDECNRLKGLNHD